MTGKSCDAGHTIRPQRGEEGPMHDNPVIRWGTVGYKHLRMTNTSCVTVVPAYLLPLDALLAREHVRAVLGSQTGHAEGV